MPGPQCADRVSCGDPTEHAVCKGVVEAEVEVCREEHLPDSRGVSEMACQRWRVSDGVLGRGVSVVTTAAERGTIEWRCRALWQRVESSGAYRRGPWAGRCKGVGAANRDRDTVGIVRRHGVVRPEDGVEVVGVPSPVHRSSAANLRAHSKAQRGEVSIAWVGRQQ